MGVSNAGSAHRPFPAFESRWRGPPYELSAHAAVVIAERDIELAWVDRAFLHPERTEADRNDPSLRHALRRIAERDDRVLRVIYNDSVDPPKIITAYFDRRQRGKP